MDRINNNVGAAESSISPITRVAPSATILQGLNEKFALLQPGQSITAQVTQLSGNQVVIESTIGNLLLWTNTRFQIGQEVHLTRLNQPNKLQFELKTGQNSTALVIEDKVEITNHEQQTWSAKAVTINHESFIKYLANAPQLLSNLGISQEAAAELDQNFWRRLRLGLRLAPKSMQATNGQISGGQFSYQTQTKSYKATTIKTELGVFQVLGHLPDEASWNVELVELARVADIGGFYSLGQNELIRLRDITSNNWPHLQQVQMHKDVAIALKGTELPELLSQIMLAVAKRKAKGYYHWLTQEVGVSETESDSEPLLMEARMLDEFNRTQDRGIFIFLLANKESEGKQGNWVKLYIKNDEQENWLRWQWEWLNPSLGEVQLVVRANKVVASQTNWASLIAEVHIADSLPKELVHNLSEAFSKLCKSYDLWGEIRFKDEPLPKIAEQLLADGIKPASGLVV